MAIRFQDKGNEPEKGRGGQPAKKEVGGKAYVAEESLADPGDAVPELPFAKPVKAEKAGSKLLR